MTSLEIAQAVATIAADKHADEIVTLDLRDISTFADFFVIASGTSEPHLRALASGIEEEMRSRHGLPLTGRDGDPASQWVIMAYGDVIIHLFHQQKREFYRLEDLWSDAPRLASPV